jgi:hypothetical protein
MLRAGGTLRTFSTASTQTGYAAKYDLIWHLVASGPETGAMSLSWFIRGNPETFNAGFSTVTPN